MRPGHETRVLMRQRMETPLHRQETGRDPGSLTLALLLYNRQSSEQVRVQPTEASRPWQSGGKWPDKLRESLALSLSGL